MRLPKLQNFLEPFLEPLIRKVVKEEVDSAFKKYSISMKWNCEKQADYSVSRSLQLKFSNTISVPVFTGARIEGEESSPLAISLINCLNGNIVSDGPESSVKVEIVVLEGDFDGEEQNNWTSEEFKNNIVREREGKKPLVTGDAFLYLKEGIGVGGDIFFTDNSSWTRSRKFKLGARVADNFGGNRIREAKTEPFVVRDHRGELYKKHYPPALHDDVWRLEKIGKDGAFHRRLSLEKIFTVKDFLVLLSFDPGRLRNILGTGMSAKMWEIAVEHARTCVIDKQLYLYGRPGSQQSSCVVFNVVGTLTGLLSDGQYKPLNKLSETEKADAHNLIVSAFGNWQEVATVENEALLIDGSFCISDTFYPSNSSIMDNSDASATLSSETIVRFDSQRLSSFFQDAMPMIPSSMRFNECGLHNIHSTGNKCNQPVGSSSHFTNSLIFDTDSFCQNFGEDDYIQYCDVNYTFPSPSLDSQADLRAVVSGFLLTRAIDRAQRRWKMLFSVFRWFSIRRIVARKPQGRTF